MSQGTAASAIVVDASVALKWALQESGSAWARGLATSGRRLLAPALLWTECANALWRIARKVQAGDFDIDTAFALVCDSPVEPIAPDRTLHLETLRVARAMDHPSYDSLYVALAVREAAVLATADRRLIRAIRRCGMLPDERLLTPPAAG